LRSFLYATKSEAVQFRNVAPKEKKMKLGEIKAEALMLMGVNNSLNISWSDIQTYKEDPTYGTYIYGMTGAINRCLSRMYVLGALQSKPAIITNTMDESAEIEIEDVLAQMVPLYVVGEVFALDEPSVAQNKRNEFEQALEEYIQKQAYADVQNDKVEIVYGA
jgi:hypothetical protein